MITPTHLHRLEIATLIEDNRSDSLFVQSCKQGLDRLPDVIEMIKDQLKDNRVMVIDMLGERCVTLIEKL